MNRICMCIVVFGLAGCSYEIETPPPEAAAPFTAYAEKIGGKWALLIDVENAKARPEAAGMRCGQFDYPLDLSGYFVQTAQITFRKVADDIRVSDHALSRAEIDSGAYTGVITIRVTRVHARLKTEGFFAPTADADTDMEATILVTKAGQRLVDADETAKGTAGRDAGLACDGAADAISEASDLAVRDLVRKLAEQFANSHALRYSASGPAAR